MQDHFINSISMRLSASETSSVSSGKSAKIRRGNKTPIIDENCCPAVISEDAPISGNSLGSAYLKLIPGSDNTTAILPPSLVTNSTLASSTKPTRQRKVTAKPKRFPTSASWDWLSNQPFITKRTSSGIITIAPQSLYPILDMLKRKWHNGQDELPRPKHPRTSGSLPD